MRPSFLDKNKSAPRPTRSRSKAAITRKIRSQPPRRRARATTSSPPPKTSSGFFSSLIKFTSLILLFMFGTGVLLYLKRDDWAINTLFNNNSEETTPVPDPAKYTLLTTQLEQNRAELRMRYLRAETNLERQNIITEASSLIEDRLPAMMRCWLGHPWDFNGTATVPGEGKIACGYFVTTIMRDAGFKINRVRVAQQPSQNIIRTFVEDREFYEIKTNTPYLKYLDHINAKYEGIHIVGLDKHVAFIVIKDGEMRFIHSKGYACVVDEAQQEASALKNSNYRVISNISRNKNVIKKWILGKTFVTVQ